MSLEKIVSFSERFSVLSQESFKEDFFKKSLKKLPFYELFFDTKFKKIAIVTLD